MQLKIGRDTRSFEALEQQADVAKRAGIAFAAMVRDLESCSKHATLLAQIEHEGDELTHKLQDDVASQFITAIDKEDLRGLSQSLDDITDSIEAVAARMCLYRVTKVREDLLPLADLIVQCTETVHAAIAEMRTGFRSPSLHTNLERIHALENQSDCLFRDALSTLFFEADREPINVMVWKEIYDRVEVTMDICEGVAKILGTISVKYA